MSYKYIVLQIKAEHSFTTRKSIYGRKISPFPWHVAEKFILEPEGIFYCLWPLKAKTDLNSMSGPWLCIPALASTDTRANKNKIQCCVSPLVTTRTHLHTLNTHGSRQQCHYSGPCVWVMTASLWDSQTPIILCNASYHTLRGSTLILLLSNHYSPGQRNRTLRLIATRRSQDEKHPTINCDDFKMFQC